MLLYDKNMFKLLWRSFDNSKVNKLYLIFWYMWVLNQKAPTCKDFLNEYIHCCILTYYNTAIRVYLYLKMKVNKSVDTSKLDLKLLIVKIPFTGSHNDFFCLSDSSFSSLLPVIFFFFFSCWVKVNKPIVNK